MFCPFLRHHRPDRVRLGCVPDLEDGGRRPERLHLLQDVLPLVIHVRLLTAHQEWVDPEVGPFECPDPLDALDGGARPRLEVLLVTVLFDMDGGLEEQGSFLDA